MGTPHHRSSAPVGDESRPDPGKLSANSAELPVAATASLDELRREWRRLYHRDPPRISRDLLIRGIGYRIAGTPTRRARQVDASQA